MRSLALALLFVSFLSATGSAWSKRQFVASPSAETCQHTVSTCALNFPTSTAAGSVFWFSMRCGSFTFHDVCQPSSVATYTGTATANGATSCSGSIVDTFTINTSIELTDDDSSINLATGYVLKSSSTPASCVLYTRNTTTADRWYFIVDEYTSGGLVTVDGTPQGESLPDGTSWTGETLTLTGTNDLQCQAFTAGISLDLYGSFSPTSWQPNEVFIDHLASSCEMNVNNSTKTTPTLSTSSTGFPGNVNAMAFKCSGISCFE
jgi:hypothetical protein